MLAKNRRQRTNDREHDARAHPKRSQLYRKNRARPWVLAEEASEREGRKAPASWCLTVMAELDYARWLRRAQLLLLGGVGLAACSDRTADDDDGSAADEVEPGQSTAPCDPGQAILGIDETPTGMFVCEHGAHRVEVVGCGEFPYRDPCESETEGEGEGEVCSSSDECTQFPSGGCRGPYGRNCRCEYDCSTDEDCGPGAVCLCHFIAPPGIRSGGVCVEASCASDDDCRPGELCMLGEVPKEEPDPCVDEADFVLSCVAPGETHCQAFAGCEVAGCVESREGWNCKRSATSCDGIGRPLLVSAKPRKAALGSNSRWAAALGRTDAHPARASYWLEVARLEHASVASFARFTMQLLALGAPADLVAQAQRAAADEVEHARLAFGLAARFGAPRAGPGPLRLDDVTVDTAPSEVVRSLVREACVGETIGAAQAARRAAESDDDDERAVCSRIADDELRHAALAWRSLHWIISRWPRLRPLALSEVRRARSEAASTVEPIDHTALRSLVDPLIRSLESPSRTKRPTLGTGAPLY